MKHCCNNMSFFINQNRKDVEFDSEDLIYYEPKFDEYGIIIHDSGKSYIKIEFCPWCGKKLPVSKRDLWFEELEKLGIENPLEDEIPEDFNSDKWWRKNTKKLV